MWLINFKGLTTFMVSFSDYALIYRYMYSLQILIDVGYVISVLVKFKRKNYEILSIMQQCVNRNNNLV